MGISLFSRRLYVFISALLILAQSFSPLSLSQAKTVADAKLLEPASICDDAIWASGFGLPGVNDDVKAITASGANIYVVGNFSQAGNTKTRRVAKWDGARWTSPGGGLPIEFSTTDAIAVIGDNIYVGGQSGTSNPAAQSAVMKWDGASWSYLPPSTSFHHNRIRAMAVIAGDLYAAGTLFTGEGQNLSAHPILKWDGSNWSKVGDDLTGSADAIAVSGDNIYVGGGLTIGEVNAGGIAKWDGSSWTPLGSGVSTDGTPGGVRAIAANGSDVYAGGEFTSAGGVSVNYVAKWDGSNWSALGTGGNNGVSFRNVYALGINGNDVYVGGSFNVAGGLSLGSGGVLAYNIAKWNGSNWSALGSAENNGMSRGNFTAVQAIVVSGGNIFIAGDFTRAAGQNAYNVIKWNNGFSELGGEILNGLNGEVYATAVIGTDVYVGGNFTTAGGTTVNHIARWDGYAWWPLGTGSTKGVNGQVQVLVVSGNDLYVGGNFFMAGENLAFGVAKWDGSNWSAFNNGSGFGVNGGVNGIAVVGSDVYVGGFFTSASGVAVDNIAKWNGNNWSALGSGITQTFGQGTVHAIKAKGTDVYVSGNFNRAGGITANGIARWDGMNWHPLDNGLTSGGLSGNAYAMAFSGDDLYVGGSFSNAGGISANHIAMWDGDNWSALITGPHNGVNDVIFALDGDDSGVYVGGYLVFAGGLNVAGIAKWDGATWAAFGSGTGGGFDGTVRSIVVRGNDLFVGGNFIKAGEKPSYGFAAWDGSSLLSTVSQPFTPSGGGGRVTVNMPEGCSWDAKSNDDWIVLTSPATSSGGDAVTYEVRENFNALSRSGTLTIAGQTLTVRQAGLSAQSCAAAISPRSESFSSAGGSSSIDVTSSGGCLWSATSNVSWITITSDSSGIGSGSVSYRVSPNATGSSRAGKITIGGRSFSVKQKGT